MSSNVLVNGRKLVGWRFPQTSRRALRSVWGEFVAFVAKDRWVGGMQQVGLHLRQHMLKLRPKIGAGGRREGCHERRKAGQCVSALLLQPHH